MMTNKIKEIKVKETKEIKEIKEIEENMKRFSDTSLLRFHPTTRTLLVSKWQCSQYGPERGTQAHSQCQ